MELGRLIPVQRVVKHPADLGKKAVPASKPGADIETERDLMAEKIHRTQKSTSTQGATENGQRQTREPDAHVGQRSGGEDQMSIPPVRRGADTSSERTVPGSRRHGQ